MTEFMELVDIAVFADQDPEKCPFKKKTGQPNVTTPTHSEDAGEGAENDENSPQSNYTVNCSGDLAKSLGDAITSLFPPTPLDSSALPPIRKGTIGPNLDENCGVTPNAHHLIPGNAALPKSKVCAYMGEKSQMPEAAKMASKIQDAASGIGYNVNDGKGNGVWLPSNNTLRGNWSGQRYQAEYAFLAINRSQAQFHDAHPDYSSFCVEQLDAIELKITSHVNSCEDCKGQRKEGKFESPPIPYLRLKIEGVASRMRIYLKLANVKNWHPKAFTSRFNGFYKQVRNRTPKGNSMTLQHDGAAVNLDKFALRVVDDGIASFVSRDENPIG